MNITFNGFAERLMKLDDLYLSIQKVSGFTVEQLFNMFMVGYTMTAPNDKDTCNPGFQHERNTSWLGYAMRKKEVHTMKVSYNGFTGELVKLERVGTGKIAETIIPIDLPGASCEHVRFYNLSIYSSEKEVTHSFTGVKLEDVKFIGGEVSFS